MADATHEAHAVMKDEPAVLPTRDAERDANSSQEGQAQSKTRWRGSVCAALEGVKMDHVRHDVHTIQSTTASFPKADRPAAEEIGEGKEDHDWKRVGIHVPLVSLLAILACQAVERALAAEPHWLRRK